MKISELKKAILSLTEEERRILLSDLKLEHYATPSYLEGILQKQDKDQISFCPHCKGENIWSRGSYQGVKRKQCKDCGKYFTATYGTPIHHIHKKNKWQSYLQCMEEGLSLRETALRVGISLQTSFNWRHKILSGLAGQQADKFSGIVESDEFYLKYSEKGAKNLARPSRRRGTDGKGSEKENKVGVLVTIDRTGKKMAKVIGKSIMSRQELDNALKIKTK